MNITIKGVKKSFGDKLALNIPYYEIHTGEIIGLVGNNGAGKTTMFRIILDLLHADEGEVTIHGNAGEMESCGAVAEGVSPDTPVAFVTSQCEDWKLITGAYVDSSFLIEYLTPEEYFRFVAKVCGLSDDELSERLAAFENFMNGEVMGQGKLIRNLSMGNKQKVGIIAAMLSHPRVLILDEPFNFLDPSSQLAIKYLLESYHRKYGATIIVSSHNLTHTFDICTRVTLLEHGLILKDYDKDYAQLTAEIEEYFKGNVNY